MQASVGLSAGSQYDEDRTTKVDGESCRTRDAAAAQRLFRGGAPDVKLIEPSDVLGLVKYSHQNYKHHRACPIRSVLYMCRLQPSLRLLFLTHTPSPS